MIKIRTAGFGTCKYIRIPKMIIEANPDFWLEDGKMVESLIIEKTKNGYSIKKSKEKNGQ